MSAITLQIEGKTHLTSATILIEVVILAAHAIGQDAVSPKPYAGKGSDASYSNECLALAYRLPDGWKFAKITQARTGAHPNLKSLFKVQRNSATGSAESLGLDVMQTPTLKHPNMERFTILLAMSYVQVDATTNKITRNAYPVTIAGSKLFPKRSA
jgi:hypothetical protein